METTKKFVFSGKAIETFEQSPTKSVSSEERQRHGITTEYFYNGRKRRIISLKMGKDEFHGIQITGALAEELLEQ